MSKLVKKLVEISFIRDLVFKHKYKKFCKEFLSVLRRTSPANEPNDKDLGFWLNYYYYLCFERDIRVEAYRGYQFYKKLFKKNYKKYFSDFDIKFVNKITQIVQKNYIRKKKYNLVIIYSDYFKSNILKFGFN